jgi:hypothetical protein
MAKMELVTKIDNFSLSIHCNLAGLFIFYKHVDNQIQ